MRPSAVLFAITLVGCGSGDVCESTPAPCGGDLVGTWSGVDTCFETACQGFEYTKKPDNTSTLTFRSDGMATASVSLTGTIGFKQPVACLTGAANQCSDLNAPAMNGNSVMCTGDTTCDCTGTVSLTVSSPAAFPYTTQGTNVTFGMSTLGYCVEGDRLFMRFVSSGSGPIATSTLVFERK